MNYLINLKKKLKRFFRIVYWFIIYDIFNGRYKRVWHLFRIGVRHLVFKTPHSLIIETGNTCNFSCPTCPTPHELIYSRRPREIMIFDSFKKIIDHAKDCVHVVYLYNSNEPLLNPDIIKMINYASDNDLHTMISTNASLLDESMSRKLLDSGLGEIRFAFDGLTKESFEGFRCGGDFETVKRNIENFCRLKKEAKKSRVITTLQFILNKLNEDQVEDIKKFCKENDIDRLYIKAFILSEYAYPKEKIKELADKFFIDKDVTDENIVYKKENFELKPKRKITTCPEVQKIFSVLSNGNAVTCCFDLYGDYSYGNMITDDFKTIWFSKKSKELRRMAKKRKLPLCKVCGNIE